MRTLAVIGSLAIIIVFAAAVFFFGGFYSVAGTAEDPGFLNWALVHVRQASIDRHATEAPSIALDDPATEPLSASGPGAPLALEHCGPIFLVRAHSMVFKL